MSTYPFSSKRKISPKIIIIGLAALIIIGAASAGAYVILRQYVPHKTSQQVTSGQGTSGATSLQQKANDLLQKNDLKNAKTAYEQASAAYTAEHNTVAAADARQQVAMIEAAISKTGPTDTTPTPKSTGKSSSAK